MLTISTIKNSGGAAQYYSKEDNYYLSEVDAKEASLWLGEGAARLGLSGKVEERDLHDLLQGKLPNGNIISLQKDGTINHRAGYDLCFQAPKSVSILALDGGHKRIYDAHLGAVKETLKIIERDCAQAKIFKDEQISFTNTKNLTIALVAHTTSRKQDLHLHHHALVMNCTQRSDNAWRALASSKMRSDRVNGFFERIHKNQIYYGLIYKTALANKVVKLGHEIETVGPYGMWEIKGVPKEAREIMSKRRQEIEKRIKDLNYRSLKSADIATLDTRKKKATNIDINEIKQLWKNDLASVGFSSNDYIATIDRNKDTNKNRINDLKNTQTINPIISANAKEAVYDAIEHLSQYNLKLDYTKIAAQALEFSIGNAEHIDIINALNEVIQKREIIPLNNSDSLFVTKALIETEKAIMDVVDKSKDSGSPIKLKSSAIDTIADGEIKENSLKILQSKERIHLIEHMAAGNREFISTVLNLAESSGKTVRVLSPNRMMTNDINENVKRRPNGLWQWLVSLGKPEVGECLAGFQYKYQKEVDLSLFGMRQGKDVLVVNNAENLGCSDTKSLLDLTAKTGAKLIFLRDTSIRLGFNAGNPMETIKQAGLKAITFTAKSNKTSDRIPEVRVLPDNNERTQALAQTFTLKDDKERDNTLLLVGAKALVKSTNEAIRSELKNIERLSGIEYRISVLNSVNLSKTESRLAHKYQMNMIIRFYNNGRIHEDWSVEGYNRDNNTLRLKLDGSRGNRQVFNPKHGNENYKVFKRELLSIAKGEKLIATSKMGILGINNADRFTVTEVNENYIGLSDGTKTYKISPKDLQNSHFDYNYATTLSNCSQKKAEHVIADFKAYSLDKPTLNDLNLRAKDSLTIFTNDAKTIQTRFGFTPVKLTAAETVLKAANPDRFISDKTIDDIKRDVELAISAMGNRDDSVAKKAVDFAIEKITSRAAGFTHKELVTESLAYALKDQVAVFGKEITHEDVMKVIDEKRKSGELVMGQYFEDGTRWTTKEILSLERSIIKYLKSGIDKLEPFLDKATASKLIENTSLTQDQKNACHLITTTKDQFVIVQGYAGTGKTTMFSQVQSMLKEAAQTQDQAKSDQDIKTAESKKETIKVAEGIVPTKETKENETKTLGKMFALAPTHRAVRELKNVGIEAQTLKSFLAEQKNMPTTTLDNRLIVLDEASMVSNNDFTKFLTLVKGSNAHIVLSGDIAQHIAIESGKPFEIAQRANILKTTHLKEIIRQKNPVLKEVVQDVIKGDYSSAFEKIAQEDPGKHIDRIETVKESQFFNSLKNSIVEIDNNQLKPGEKTEELFLISSEAV